MSSLLGAKGKAEEKAVEIEPVAAEVVTTEGTIVTMSGLKEGLIPIEYNGAPALKALVEQGKLPPVEERLPKEPLVIEPYEKGETL